MQIAEPSYLTNMTSDSDSKKASLNRFSQNMIRQQLQHSAGHNHTLPVGLREASIVFTQWSKKWVFRPTVATHCRMPNFTFTGAEMWYYSPQTCQNFEFWP